MNTTTWLNINGTETLEKQIEFLDRLYKEYRSNGDEQMAMALYNAYQNLRVLQSVRFTLSHVK